VAVIPSTVRLRDARPRALPLHLGNRQLGVIMSAIWDPRRYLSPAVGAFVEEAYRFTRGSIRGRGSTWRTCSTARPRRRRGGARHRGPRRRPGQSLAAAALATVRAEPGRRPAGVSSRGPQTRSTPAAPAPRPSARRRASSAPRSTRCSRPASCRAARWRSRATRRPWRPEPRVPGPAGGPRVPPGCGRRAPALAGGAAAARATPPGPGPGPAR
jgi:hypothetical protein